MDFTRGQVDEVWRHRLDSLRLRLIEQGTSVFNAHHNEAWGSGWLPADECTAADFAAMRVADVVCALVGVPASGGVLTELGWASALGKPIVLVLSPDASYSPLVHGLGEITDVEPTEEPVEWSAAEIAKLADQVVALGERHLAVADVEPVRGWTNLDPLMGFARQ